MTSSRGYASGCEPVAHFGLGDVAQLDEVRITWPDGRRSTLRDVPTKQLLRISRLDDQ